MENIRDHGGVSLIDPFHHLYGLVQIVIHNSETVDMFCTASSAYPSRVRLGFSDPGYRKTQKSATGTVELVASEVNILGDILEPPPFEVPTLLPEVKEELRLKYKIP